MSYLIGYAAPVTDADEDECIAAVGGCTRTVLG
jgi:hypothetical protein